MSDDATGETEHTESGGKAKPGDSARDRFRAGPADHLRREPDFSREPDPAYAAEYLPGDEPIVGENRPAEESQIKRSSFRGFSFNRAKPRVQDDAAHADRAGADGAGADGAGADEDATVEACDALERPSSAEVWTDAAETANEALIEGASEIDPAFEHASEDAADRAMAEEAARAEAERLAEEARLAEESRLAEEARLAEARAVFEREIAERKQREIEAAEAAEAEERAAAAARAAAEERARELAERDAFIEENNLGSLLRGARATLGKHDIKAVERELRIKARYLKAIEALDLDNLPSEAYLPGYVRTYATYLREALPMSPEEALAKFRQELAEKRGVPLVAESEKPSAEDEARRAAARLSEKVAPRISRKAIDQAKSQRAAGAARQEADQGASPSGDGAVAARSSRRAAADRPSPADALRARAEVARAGDSISDPLSRARRSATLDPMAKIQRMGEEARAAAPKAPMGRATVQTAGVVAKRRKEAAEREAMRAAEVARASRRANSAALRGPSGRGVDAVGPGVALLTAVLVIGGLSYGAWALLTDVQKVTVGGDGERTLTVIDRRDPTAGAAAVSRPAASAYERGGVLTEGAEPAPPGAAPIDGPIGGLAGRLVGAETTGAANAPSPDQASSADVREAVDEALAAAAATAPDPVPAAAPAAVPAAVATSFAVHALDVSWIRVRDRAGAEVFAGQLEPGAVKPLDPKGGPYEIRTGNAGGVALVVDGRVRGPLGAKGALATVAISREEAVKNFAEMPDATAALGKPRKQPGAATAAPAAAPAAASASETGAPSGGASERPAVEAPERSASRSGDEPMGRERDGPTRIGGRP